MYYKRTCSAMAALNDASRQKVGFKRARKMQKTLHTPSLRLLGLLPLTLGHDSSIDSFRPLSVSHLESAHRRNPVPTPAKTDLKPDLVIPRDRVLVTVNRLFLGLLWLLPPTLGHDSSTDTFLLHNNLQFSRSLLEYAHGAHSTQNPVPTPAELDLKPDPVIPCHRVIVIVPDSSSFVTSFLENDSQSLGGWGWPNRDAA
jgi:hypothetical protein